MSALMDLGLDQTKFAKVSNIDFGDRDASRFLIGIPTIDKLFGDKGVMPGTITIVSAGVGAGKTTFLLQVLESIALTANKRVGYVSGEEDVSQLAYNAHRIGVANVKVANMSDVDHICDSVLNKFDVIVIDSFQCLSSQVVKGKNKAQLYSIARLVKAVKATNCVVFIILHLTKDGKFKGDSTVGHAVDVTMQITKGEMDTWGHDQARTISVSKNRFGRTGEVTLRMTDKGYDFTHELEIGEPTPETTEETEEES